MTTTTQLEQLVRELGERIGRSTTIALADRDMQDDTRRLNATAREVARLLPRWQQWMFQRVSRGEAFADVVAEAAQLAMGRHLPAGVTRGPVQPVTLSDRSRAPTPPTRPRQVPRITTRDLARRLAREKGITIADAELELDKAARRKKGKK